MAISIPVCLRHYFVMLFVRSLLFVSCTTMIIFGIPSLISLLDPSLFSDHSSAYFIVFFVSLVVFVISVKWQPIKLTDIDQYSFTLFLRNDDYANEFSSINQIKHTS